MRAVVLVIRFAKLALETGTDLSANANTVSDLDSCHLVADFDRLANNFMTDADRERTIAPTASDGMDIRAADTAALNFDVDITIFKLLWFELGTRSTMCRMEAIDSMNAHFFFLKVSPFALILDHVALEHFWVRHLDCGSRRNRWLRLSK